jgi:tetrahydromethanopterin S-methyltransferase subunit G
VIHGTPGSDAPITISAPRSARDIDALQARRDEISKQLTSVDGRRSKLLSQLRSTGDPTAVKGLQDRLALLDARQLQLESDLSQTGQALSSVGAGLIATSTSAGPVFAGLGPGQTLALSIVFTIFVLGPLAVGFARTLFKRSTRPALPPAVFNEAAQRLERVEAAVETIALEIERISEGQRFVTKLLSESQPAPQLGAGQRSAEPVRST